MAIATNAALGTVILQGGDLLGSDATTPELVPTGVTPGSYVAAGVYVDVKGRVLYAKSIEEINLPCATEFACGLVKPVGHIDIDGDSRISIPLATTDDYGVVTIGSGFDVAGCEISVTPPTATTTVLGAVIVPTSGHIDVAGDGSISIPLASDSSLGLVRVGSGFEIVGGTTLQIVVDYDDASTSTKGIMQIGEGLNDALGSGIVSANIAQNTTFGVVREGNANHITVTNTTGLVDVGSNVLETTYLDTDYTFTQAQASLVYDYPSVSGTFSPDWLQSNAFSINLVGDTTIEKGSISTPLNGASVTMFVETNGYVCDFGSGITISSSPTECVGKSIVVLSYEQNNDFHGIILYDFI